MTGPNFDRAYWAGLAAWMVTFWTIFTILAAFCEVDADSILARIGAGAMMALIAWVTANVVEQAVVRRIRNGR